MQRARLTPSRQKPPPSSPPRTPYHPHSKPPPRPYVRPFFCTVRADSLTRNSGIFLHLVAIWVTLLITIALFLVIHTPEEDFHSSAPNASEHYVPPHLPPPTLSSIESKYASSPSRSVLSATPKVMSFNDHNFTLDTQPIRLVSGSIHYFRMVPSSWRPVLLHARAMGLNAISTYVPWNFHEPNPGHFRFSGMLDLRAFLELAHDVGLMVLLRPGPYICSEWENGGLPPYLLADENMELRSSYKPYMDAARRYLEVVASEIRPYIGRPIVALQIENEYGIYGADRAYMHELLAIWKEEEITKRNVLLFTSENGPAETVLRGSPFEDGEVLKMVNLEKEAGQRIKMLRGIQKKGPAMVSEFWTGWFDHWGKDHHVRSGSEIVKQVSEILNEYGGSVNMYMFFGGTNFGFMNGANIDRTGKYWSVVTSYDYDGMLNEMGGLRKEKYLPMQKMLREFWKGLKEEEMVKRAYGKVEKTPRIERYAGRVELDESIGFHDVVDVITDKRKRSILPMWMEHVGGDYGFIIYRHNLTVGDGSERILRIRGVRDFAHILVDRKVVKRVGRNEEHGGGKPKEIKLEKRSKTLEIIVENRGRVTVGPFIHDRKGIVGKVEVNGKAVEGFESRTVSFVEDHKLLRDHFGRQSITLVRKMMSGKDRHGSIGDSSSGPVFFRGELRIGGEYARFKQELSGTHCRIEGQGVLWVNGFNVGRFDSGAEGPQKTLYVPGELLQEGLNEFLVLHMRLDLMKRARIELVTKTEIGEE